MSDLSDYMDGMLGDAGADYTGDYDTSDLTGGTRYPFLQWVDANPGNAQMPQGGFVWDTTTFPPSLQAPWQVSNVILGTGGATKPCYLIPTLEALVLAHRQDWGIALADGTKRATHSGPDGYKTLKNGGVPPGASIRGRTRYLVLVKGGEAAGPAMLTLWGVKGKHLANAISTWFRDFYTPANAAFTAAGHARGREVSLPPFAAYVPLIAGDAQRANPKFAAMITPAILPPVFAQYSPEQKVNYFMANALASNEMRTLAASYYKAAQEWAEAPLATIDGPQFTGGQAPAQRGSQQQGQPQQAWGAQPPPQQAPAPAWGGPPPPTTWQAPQQTPPFQGGTIVPPPAWGTNPQ
jgi:hypothetical protein